MSDTRGVQENLTTVRRAISHLRWWIAGALFASTIINYLDRQTLSLLAPFLKIQYHWTNTDYAYIVIAFRIAYAIGANRLGPADGQIGHPSRPDVHCCLVFPRVSALTVGQWIV